MEYKYYYSLKNIKPFEECVAEFKKISAYNEKKGLNYDCKFIYLLDEKDLLDADIEKKAKIIMKKLLFSGIRKSEYTISFNHQTMNGNLNGQSLKALYNLERKFGRVNFGIENGDTTWHSDEVAHANSQLDDIANEIKQNNMSPVEMLLSAYIEVIKRPYKEVSAKESLFKSRTIYGILNSDKIVCVGYTEYFNEIISRLDLPNVKTFFNFVQVGSKKNPEYHQNMIIYLKDEKYGIDGYYYFDPTWDSIKEGDKQPRLNFFMLPIDEIKNINIRRIQPMNTDFDCITKPEKYKDRGTMVFNIPTANNRISVFSTGAMVNKNALKFLKQDEQLKPIFETMHRQHPNEEKMFRNYEFFAYNMLNRRSQNIDGLKMEEIIKNTVSKLRPNFSNTQIEQETEQICKENCKYAQENFDYLSNSVFKNLMHKKEAYNQDTNDLTNQQ